MRLLPKMKNLILMQKGYLMPKRKQYLKKQLRQPF